MSKTKKILIIVGFAVCIFAAGFGAGYSVLSARIRSSGSDGVSGLESSIASLQSNYEQLIAANQRLEDRNTELEQYADSLAGNLESIGLITDSTAAELDEHERTLGSIGQSASELRQYLSSTRAICDILKERDRVAQEAYRRYKEGEAGRRADSSASESSAGVE